MVSSSVVTLASLFVVSKSDVSVETVVVGNVSVRLFCVNIFDQET